MIVSLNDKSPNQIYHLMTQTLIPRPIAWVLTDSSKEQESHNYNLAPFSYFTAVSSAPPLMMISIGKKPSGEDKDTITNVKNGSRLVIHIASGDQFGDVTASAETLEHGESEIDKLGLELSPFEGFSLPRLKNCHIAFGCRLFELQTIGDTPQQLLFAEVESIYIDDKVVSTSQTGRVIVDADKVSPLARLGASQYGLFGDIVSQSRPR
mgnify:CR=1 FL=1